MVKITLVEKIKPLLGRKQYNGIFHLYEGPAQYLDIKKLSEQVGEPLTLGQIQFFKTLYSDEYESFDTIGLHGCDGYDLKGRAYISLFKKRIKEVGKPIALILTDAVPPIGMVRKWEDYVFLSDTKHWASVKNIKWIRADYSMIWKDIVLGKAKEARAKNSGINDRSLWAYIDSHLELSA
jgi:hypothetical protein